MKLKLSYLRVFQIAEVLEEILKFKYPADSVLSNWFKNNKKLGHKDRGIVASAVFDILRNLRKYRNYAQSGVGPENQRLALLGLNSIYSADEIKSMLKEDQEQWFDRVLNIDESSLNDLVKYSVPEWLFNKVSQLQNFENLLNSLNQKAPLDIRANPLKASREEILEIIKRDELLDDIDYSLTKYSPWGIRIKTNPSLNTWDIFKSGLIEVQDEGSQILCQLVSPKRSDWVVDFCAGAGGKTLLLGALMHSHGRLYALDTASNRLAKAKPRLARSGLSNVTCIPIKSENDERVKRLFGKVDKVLVDAPCTGLGTLRRNPDLKWRQTPKDLQELIELQEKILKAASRCIKKGGRLIYSTCSILPQENQQQIEKFLSNNPEFKLINPEKVLGDRITGLESHKDMLILRPDVHGTDGFFAAVLERVE